MTQRIHDKRLGFVNDDGSLNTVSFNKGYWYTRMFKNTPFSCFTPNSQGALVGQ